MSLFGDPEATSGEGEAEGKDPEARETPGQSGESGATDDAGENEDEITTGEEVPNELFATSEKASEEDTEELGEDEEGTHWVPLTRLQHKNDLIHELETELESKDSEIAKLNSQPSQTEATPAFLEAAYPEIKPEDRGTRVVEDAHFMDTLVANREDPAVKQALQVLRSKGAFQMPEASNDTTSKTAEKPNQEAAPTTDSSVTAQLTSLVSENVRSVLESNDVRPELHADLVRDTMDSLTGSQDFSRDAIVKSLEKTISSKNWSKDFVLATQPKSQRKMIPRGGAGAAGAESGAGESGGTATPKEPTTPYEAQLQRRNLAKSLISQMGDEAALKLA